MKVNFRICLFLCAAVLISGCKKTDGSKKETKGEGKTMTETKQEIKKASVKVELDTTMGKIVIELDEEKAPITTANFLRYVKEGFYDGTIFHRVIGNFMIQSGGHLLDMTEKTAYEPIKNEASNGLANSRGTIAMARTSNPNSATSQFYINLVDNKQLNFIPGQSPGYAVFGKVIEGMDVVDKIGTVKTTKRLSYFDVPVEPVLINSAKVVP